MSKNNNPPPLPKPPRRPDVGAVFQRLTLSNDQAGNRPRNTPADQPRPKDTKNE